MDAEKLAKLEEKLYNETPFLGDRIRQQAAKELAEDRSLSAIEALAKGLVFSKDKKVKSIVLNSLRKIKLQEKELVNAVCGVWAENRDPELGTFMKLRGWVAYNPLNLRLLTAINLGWQGIIEEKGIEIVKPLFGLFQDQSPQIQAQAQQWATSFTTPELQQEVCRLASEENNQFALKVATEAGYVPTEPSQGALFYYFTQQWDQYQKVDPEYKLLEETYYKAPEELKNRIDEHGKTRERAEWAWIVLGGKDIRRSQEVTFEKWQEIIDVLADSKQWETLWSLITSAPVICGKTILKKLQQNRWLPKNPQDKQKLAELTKLTRMMKANSVPQGKLVRCVHTLRGHTQAIEAIAVSPDGKTLYSAGDELIRVWDIPTGKQINTLKAHLKGVTSLCLSKDGTILASGSRDKTICLWRLPDGNLITNLSANVASVWALSMTNNAQIIASGSYRETRLWQYPPGRLFKTLKGHKREVECTAISDDGKFLVTGGGKSDNTVRVWDLPSGENRYTLEGHQDAIWCLAICPDSKILASGSLDHNVKLWSLSTGDEIATLDAHQGRIWCLGITPEGKMLITGGDDCIVNFWQLTTGKLLTSLKGHTDAVWCLDVSQDGNIVATGGKDTTVRLWSLPDGDNVGLLAGHIGGIRCVKITQDRQTLITASQDKTLRIWKWDLSRLCYVAIIAMTEDDHLWIKDTLENQEITSEEKSWLILLEKLINLKLN